MKSRVRTSAVVVHNGKILSFRAIDPSSGQEYYFLPGGKIESDETAPEAAEREALEETGYQIQVYPESCVDSEYVFEWNGESFNCLTLFYRGILKSEDPSPVNDASYNKGVHWVAVKDVKKYFSYSAEILEAVESLL